MRAYRANQAFGVSRIRIGHATLCHVYAYIHALSHELFILTFNEDEDDDEEEDDEDTLK